MESMGNNLTGCTLAFAGQAQEEANVDNVEVYYDNQPAGAAADSDNTAALLTFPYCRCDDYKCSSGPYKLVPTSLTPATPTVSVMCFTFQFTGCGLAATSCCRKIMNDVSKIEFSTGMYR